MDPIITEISGFVRANFRGEENWEYIRNYLYERSDMIAECGSNYIHSQLGWTSALLVGIEEINNTLIGSVLLSLHSEVVTERIGIPFLQSVRKFLMSLNKSVSFSIQKEIINICSKSASLANRTGTSKSMIMSFEHALDQLHTGPFCLSPIHPCILEACISSQLYTHGYKFISSRSIREINQKQVPISSQDFLRYFYYAGVICIGVKQNSDAIDYFLQVLSTPAMVLSLIVADSVKKLRLITLLDSGSQFITPKSLPLSGCVLKFLKQPMPVYDNLISAFQNNDLASLQTTIDTHIVQDTLNKDGNLGLARQLPKALIRNRIRTLANSYITMGLGDISRAVGISSESATEGILVEMALAGDIRVRIDQVARMAHFSESAVERDAVTARNDDSDGREEEVIWQLERNLDVTMNLLEELSTLQKQVITSNEYVTKVSSTSLGAKWQGEDDDVMDMSSMGRFVL